MKKIAVLCSCFFMFLSYSAVSFAEDCQNFSKSKVFPTKNIVALRMVKQKAESCSVYYAGFIVATKAQKEILLEEMIRNPKNKAIRRLFEKVDKELTLALVTEVALAELQEDMKEKIEELTDPELPKLRKLM